METQTVVVDEQANPVLRVGGMEVFVAPMLYAGAAIAFVVYLALGALVFRHGVANAIVGALVLTVLHEVNEVVHNYGHFTAARRAGHPMTGVLLGTHVLFATSLYPPEGDLPAAVHVRRALGGPAANAVLTVVGLVITVVLFVVAPREAWVGIVWTAENLVVFTIGNFLPFGFNDGSTLLRWRGKS